jgi:hypothetical protein
MLSPSKWHEQVPKERDKNLKFRGNLYRLAGASKQAQADLREACRQDILFYVNAFCWTFSPKRRGSKVVPFITWPSQDHAFKVILEHVAEQKSLVIEKSRDEGATWIFCYCMDWLCHFHDYNQCLMVSRVGDLVDGKTPDALFWKIDFAHKFQPDWLAPKTNRLKKYIEYLDTSSTTTGQATTEDMGIGGRATVMGFDEFSRVPNGHEVLEGTRDTAYCRIFISTHTGPGTAFHKVTTNGITDKLVLHWSQNPNKNQGLYRYNVEAGKVEIIDKKNPPPLGYQFVMDGSPSGGPFPGLRSPWYDRECVERGSKRDVAQNLDIDIQGSSHQFFDPLTIRLLKNTYCTPPLWEGELHYDADSGRPLELVKVEGGHLKLWINPLHTGKIKAAPYYGGADISTGSGATPSCAQFLNALGEQIAEYVNAHLDPKMFAVLCVALCWLLRNEDGEGALFAWEQQGPGAIFGKKVIELGYRNILYKENEQMLVPKNFTPADPQPGWYPSPENRRRLLEELRSALATRACTVRSEQTLDECLDFKYGADGNVEHAGEKAGDDPTAARINHGDRVIPMGLAWKMAVKRGVNRPAEKKAEQVKPGSLHFRILLEEQRRREEQAWA